MKKEIIWVCEECGSDDIVEKIWASVNDTIIEECVCYQKYSGEVESGIWCDDCNMETEIIQQKEVK